MTNVLVHRCRLFDFTPSAIHGIATTSTSNNFAISRANGNIEIWCTTPNLLKKLVIPGSGTSVEALLWIGNRLISGGISGEILEYDLKTGTTKFSIDSYGGAVWCVAHSPNQSHLAAGCEDGSVKLFDVENETIKYERAFDKQEARILSISWHPGGNVIATGSSDIIRLWSVKTGHALQKILLERLSHKLETIVWSVIMLSDYTVISGDSYGRVQFWNGKNGTLLDSHQVFRSHVLCMCLGEDETTVYAAGVDPKVIEFAHVSAKNSVWKMTRQMQRHSHDIRAIGLTGGKIFSGGVDTTLRMKAIHPNPRQDRFFQSNCFPLYSNHLDLWKIAESDKPENFQPGEFVPIDKNPIKLIKISKPPSDPNIISCSCLSPCGRWLAYSNSSAARLYRVRHSDENVIAKIDRIHCPGLTSAHVIIFTPDSSHMILSVTNHKLLSIELKTDSDEVSASLQHSTAIKHTNTITHLLTISSDSKLLASATLDGQVEIFDVVNLAHICSLPRRQEVPTAISFLPGKKQLVITFASMQATRMDLKTQGESMCGRIADTIDLLRIRNHSANRFHAVITKIFHRVQGKTISSFFISTEGIYVVEKNLNETKTRFCNDFALLLFADLLDDETLFVIERSAHDVYSQLPPALYQKKFGT